MTRWSRPSCCGFTRGLQPRCQIGRVADHSLLVSNHVTYVVQVNGKKRGELTIERDAGEKQIESAALALDGVVRATNNKPARKVIIVPLRIVNVVV